MVAKGYNQIEGIDFREIFSPIAKLRTVCMVLVVTFANNWSLHQSDVNITFFAWIS